MQLKKALFQGALLYGICWAGQVAAVQDGVPAPPEVRHVDLFGVNLEIGQVTNTLETVSIGGRMGLSHSVSVHSSWKRFFDSYAYHDKYAGSTRYVTVIDNNDPNSSYRFQFNGVGYRHFRLMRVSGPAGSEDFVPYVNGQVVNDAMQIDSDTVYVALGDTRNTLEFAEDGDMVWTTPDGTQLHYRTLGQEGRLKKVVYPNGFTLDTFPFAGVISNTGFQLKYDYLTDSRTLSPEKVQIKASMPSYASLPSEGSGQWSTANPKYIRGINRAVEYCALEQAPCSLEHEWPTATFSYPGGMPLAVFLGKSVFTVEDANGGLTEYHYESQDVMLRDVHDPESYIGEYPYKQGYMWAPRLVAIKAAGSNEITTTYEYRNRIELQTLITCDGPGLGLCGAFSYWELLGVVGEITKATSLQGDWVTYSWDQPANAGLQDMRHDSARRSRSLSRVETNASLLGGIRSAIIAGEGTYFYENEYRQFITRYAPSTVESALPGPQKDYYYDARGNLERIVMNEGEFDETTVEASYPDTCTPATRKTCNKPTWTKDPKGNRTDYTYHQPSGQLATVTGPPDHSGVRPQTRYGYEQLYAYYKKNGESVERADTPIWLKTHESYCRTTASAGEDCVGGSVDEVVTEYDYGPQDGRPNNLLLRSVSVTAMGDEAIETRTTCYQYDIYGNRVGEMKPKGNSGSCPQ